MHRPWFEDWHNFTLKSGGDQWRRQDLVSGGHDDRGAKGASIEAPKGHGEGCLLPTQLGGLGRREPNRCIGPVVNTVWAVPKTNHAVLLVGRRCKLRHVAVGDQ